MVGWHDEKISGEVVSGDGPEEPGGWGVNGEVAGAELGEVILLGVGEGSEGNVKGRGISVGNRVRGEESGAVGVGVGRLLSLKIEYLILLYGSPLRRFFNAEGDLLNILAR